MKRFILIICFAFVLCGTLCGCCDSVTQYVWCDHSESFRKKLEEKNYTYTITCRPWFDEVGNGRGCVRYDIDVTSDEDSYKLRLLISDFRKQYNNYDYSRSNDEEF